MEPPTVPSSAPAKAPSVPGSKGRRRWWPRFRARIRQIWRRLVLLLGPILLTAVLVWGIGQFTSARIAQELLVISAVSFFGLGTTVILAPAAMGGGLEIPFTNQTFQLHLGTWEIALWLIYLNIAAAFLYAYNLDLLEKVPVIGPYLHRARSNATDALSRHPWIRRLAGLGVVFFVLLPGPGSGQLGGCFVGRVVGLTRRTTFLVVALAGSLVALSYALFGSYIKQVLDDAEVGNWIRIGGLVVALIAFGLLVKLLSYLGRDPDAEPKEKPVATGATGTSALAGWLAALFVTAAAVVAYALYRAEIERVLRDPQIRPWILAGAAVLLLGLFWLLIRLVRARLRVRAARKRAQARTTSL